MAKSLIIVESPAKTKTIKGFLGKDFAVEASMGHVRDLPSSKLGVDVDNNFEPTYVALKDRKDVLSKLAAAAKGATTVYLASDPDREGEAIAWHVANALKLKPGQIKRIQFNEITKTAVEQALLSPREINLDRVNAQQARRVLDRLVGYKISPLLWRKVKKNLSAGRVQSVAVRLISDREREIAAFIPVEYWSLTATLSPQTGRKTPFDAALQGYQGKKIELKTQTEADKVLADLRGAVYRVGKVKKSERQRKPYAPFITSTLQQEAARKLGFGAKRAMIVAQQLYEGIDLGTEGGTVGLITYMRTDSTRVSGEAQADTKQYIMTTYGPEYAPGSFNIYKSKNSAQDAHEAIRPTSVFREPDSIKMKLTPDQYKLYRLVWLRFVASQMKPAILDVVSADIDANGYMFRATGSTIKFDGFLRVYTEGKDDAKVDDEEKPPLPPLTEGQELDLVKLLPKQHFTEPPPRFSEATLVKTMEEQGIGRPSTYASIISTIQDRGYVELQEKKFRPTELGFVVTDLLVKHFPDILSIQFTSGMEDRLDNVEEGRQDWVALMREFYDPFALTVSAAEEGMERVKIEPKESDIPCPNCGRLLVERSGRFGKFLGCPGYPECKHIHKEAPKGTGVTCPDCKEGEMIEKKSKKGPFYACNRYPDCKCALPSKPITRPCPQCASILIEKGFKGRVTGVRCTNKECGYSETFEGVEEEDETAEATAVAA